MEILLTFNCCHCGKNFSKKVIKSEIKDDRLVYEIVACPHCGKNCKLELKASEVLATQVFRGEAIFSSAEVEMLQGQVFSTQPA